MLDYEKLANNLCDAITKDFNSPTVSIPIKEALDIYTCLCGMNHIKKIIESDNPGATK